MACTMTPIKRRYTFWINDTEADGLRQVKAAEGIAESEQIRQAIRDWLGKKGVTGKSERKRARKGRKAKGDA
jgi:hypothetical protein